jgi:hypothetical protein
VQIYEEVFFGVLVTLTEVGEQSLGGIHSGNLTKRDAMASCEPQNRLARKLALSCDLKKMKKI